ncbi:hypothetical protein SAMN05443572_11571 [Myxococcus fulvus]|uniref:Uncharacterized protein n=1 Tax=Myxococcus fulvus TaxID=33 RepID=A0A511TBZ4_MYXFU|nr:hypothetical protein [Myxococcus fulvus]GEN11709.1 hypothetical protein MFU01_67460 [Myxococcus fulvus]SEU40295.1 hypothetical protein SAMN05443572_11571 [Myxococcus fulvus]
MKSPSFECAALAAVLFLASSSVRAEEPRRASEVSVSGASLACTDLPGALSLAAQEAGVPIHPGRIATSTSDLFVISAGAVIGLENLSALEYAQGVDVAFVYVDAPGSDIPAGYYRLRATAKANDIHVGTYPGSVGFFDKTGQEVARVVGTFETSSVTSPEGGPSVPARALIGGKPPGAATLQDLMRGMVILIWTPNYVFYVPASVL